MTQKHEKTVNRFVEASFDDAGRLVNSGEFYQHKKFPSVPVKVTVRAGTSANIPKILRTVADEIEQQLRG